MPIGLLRERFELLKEHRANIISLDQGVKGLYAGTLPERSVVLTFDDGSYDFYRLVVPLLRQFGYTATVYLTTYYSDFNRPVFDVMCSYLLWKGRGQLLKYPGVLPAEIVLDDEGQATALREIQQLAHKRALSGREKDVLLASIAARLKIDYESLCSRRILHLMTPEEVAAVSRVGVDVQLHTHRHRVSLDRHKFLREIDENRIRIAASSSTPLRHFCYPGGLCLPQFPVWLRESGMVSATTCKPGLASESSDPLLLPRVVDHCNVPRAEFFAWVSGLGSLLPHRHHTMSGRQLAEEAVYNLDPATKNQSGIATGKLSKETAA